MATRALICIPAPGDPDCVHANYLHFDGMPSGAGAWLAQRATSAEQALALATGAHIRYLDRKSGAVDRYDLGTHSEAVYLDGLQDYAFSMGAEFVYHFYGSYWTVRGTNDWTERPVPGGTPVNPPLATGNSIRVRADVSHRGQKPSVCYEVYEAGPRGAQGRTILRTPRRMDATENAADRQLAEVAARAIAGFLSTETLF